MISRSKRFALPVIVAVFAMAFAGCAGSKSRSTATLGDSDASSEPAKNQKLDDARRSAEEAEQKAHELRLEKNRNTAKNGN